MTVQAIKTPDTEQERQQRLAEMSAEQGPRWREEYQPGSFGCHELLDRTAFAADMVERYVLSHPACIQNPHWFMLAEQAATALQELYQQIGQEHLSDKS